MFHYEYVKKKEWKPIRDNLEEMIHDVQNRMREDNVFTFQYHFIGSSSRNMITCDFSTNKGFDFDVDLEPNDDDENYSPQEIKELFIRYFNQVAYSYGYNCCAENSTRVITIKFVDRRTCRVIHSVDFAIIYHCSKEYVQYIHFNKDDGSYQWKRRKNSKHVEEKANWICSNGYKKDLEDLYLDKKNYNEDIKKKSRSLYAEAVKEIYDYYNGGK